MERVARDRLEYVLWFNVAAGLLILLALVYFTGLLTVAT